MPYQDKILLMKTQDEVSLLEEQISKKIKSENGCVVTFEYKENKNAISMLFNPEYTVKVFTNNPKSKETFLLKKVICDNIKSGLLEIWNYLANYKNNYDSFTIEWKRALNNIKTEKSYFYCIDAKEAVDKFYYKKERDAYIIYSVTMNGRA